MADITYTIGAKDAATPALNKVDSAMGRLEKSTKDLGESSERSLGKFSISIGSLAKAAGVFGAISLAASGLRSAFGMIAAGVDDFDAAQESMRALDQAMELNGGSSDALIDKYGALSDAIEANTNIAAEETQALMKQAAVLGVSNDQLGNMATAAVGLSEALGVSLEDGLKKARLATEGNFKAFEKLIPAIKDMTTDEEKLAAVMELSARGMAMKEAASQSAGGEAERMSHRVGNLMETIGALIAPIREVAYRGITLLADALSNVLTPAVESTRALFEQWEPVIMQAIESTVNGIIAGLTMAEVIFGNFSAVVGLVFDTIKLKYETYRADTEQLFVTTIPAYISWFGDNFFNIIETAFNAVYNTIKTYVTMVIDTLSVLWDYIASGFSANFGVDGKLYDIGAKAGDAFVNGFENTIQDLPNIAQRALTATEIDLQNSIGATAGKLAEEYESKLAARTIKIGGAVGESIADTIDLKLKKTAAKATGEAIQAQESRLLTRGTGSTSPEQSLGDINKGVRQLVERTYKTTELQMIAASELAQIKNELKLRPQLTITGVP